MASPSDRGQKRDYNGNFRDQDQVSIGYPSAPNRVSDNQRNVVSYGAQYLPQNPQSALQYNAAGYAFSSTFDTSKPPVPGLNTSRPKSALPAPSIHGTKVSLDTPEDIAAWIAERKKKWPTDANVEKNRAEKARQSATMPNKRQKKQKKGKGGQNHITRQDLHSQAQNGAIVPKSDATPATATLPSSDTVAPQPSSVDIALAALDGTIEPEAEAEAEASATPNNGKMPSALLAPPIGIASGSIEESTGPILPNGLKVSLASEESDSDVSSDSESTDSSDSSSSSDEGDTLPEVVSSKPKVTDAVTREENAVVEPTGRPRRPCKYFRSGNCTRGDACTFSHDVKTKENKRSQGHQPARVDDRYKWRKRKSLYDRLVEAELAKEEKLAGTVE